MLKPMLKIEHLTKTYGGKPAVQDLCLHIRRGELCAFIGHNGAGKTTTLKCCSGIQQFDAGEIYVDGISVRDDPLECKRRLAYLPDDPQLYDYMTGIQYLDFIADIFGVSAAQRAQRIRQYGDAFGLTPDLAQSIGAYSHGMKQKLAIIAALLHEPKLILMDEPFVGLDPLASHQLKTQMKAFCAQGGAIFFSTHVLEVAEKLCDRVAILRKGQLVREGAMEQVRGDDTLEEVFLELGAAFVRSSKTGKRRSRVEALGYALLFIVLMLLVMLSFGAMALPMALTLVPQGLDWLYFVLMELSALTVSVLASAFTSYGHLFRCRDNQQLLALPIPPGAIFAVRCGGVYLTGLIYLLLAWVPSVVCYALAAPHPGGALLAALPVALALAGVSMVLAVLLGWAVALLNRRARHKSLVTVVGTLLFLAVYYAVFQWVGNAVDALALDAVQAGAAAGRAVAPLHLLGLAAVGSAPALLLLLALAVACMVLCGKALAKPYLRLLTLEPGKIKTEYRAKAQKKQPPHRALLRRELLQFFTLLLY